MRLSASWEDQPCISAGWGGPTRPNKFHDLPECYSLNNLSHDWQLVARRENREGWFRWVWVGAFADETETHGVTKHGRETVHIKSGPERSLFLEQAFPSRIAPRISVVQGRNDDGVMCLYARWFPVLGRKTA